MTQPGQGDNKSQDQQPQQDQQKRSYRPGQIATFRVDDPTTGDEFTGHGVVLKVDGDVADVAVIGTAHVRVAVEKLAAAKVDEVPNPLPAPAPAEGSGE